MSAWRGVMLLEQDVASGAVALCACGGVICGFNTLLEYQEAFGPCQVWRDLAPKGQTC